mgnify:CR=1 FL=1
MDIDSVIYVSSLGPLWRKGAKGALEGLAQ